MKLELQHETFHLLCSEQTVLLVRDGSETLIVHRTPHLCTMTLCWNAGKKTHQINKPALPSQKSGEICGIRCYKSRCLCNGPQNIMDHVQMQSRFHTTYRCLHVYNNSKRINTNKPVWEFNNTSSWIIILLGICKHMMSTLHNIIFVLQGWTNNYIYIYI